MKARSASLVLFICLVIICPFILSSCGNGNLSGKAYLEEREMSAINIVGEAKYVYDMVVYTGKNVDFNTSIEDENGNVFYKAIDGEIATFTYNDLVEHLKAYYSDDFIDKMLTDNIYAKDDGVIYTAGTDADSGIDYIDYEVKTVEKTKIIYKVTVFYNASWTGKNPAVYEVDQERIDGNWVFTDDNDFKWGVSPQL